MIVKIVIVFYIHLHTVITSEFTQKFPHVRFVKAGENAIVTCNKTESSNFGNWQWYKEKEDGGLQKVVQSTCEGSSSNCRAKQLTVEIKNVNRSDSGVYYCSEPGLDQNFYMANTLIVTESEPEIPTVSILAPVTEHNADPETTVLLCIALNWSNNWSLLKWSIDGKELDGWQTLDPDGSLRNQIFLPTSTKEKEVICYIENLQESGNISASFSNKSEPLDHDQSQCYIILYVGLGFAVLLLVIHQIILAKIRGSLCKERPKKQDHPERRVRFKPEEEMVIYAPVKG